MNTNHWNDLAEDRKSAENDIIQRNAAAALEAFRLTSAGIDPSDRKPYSWPTCEECGERTEDVVDTASGVYCERCFDGRRQADADAAYDRWKDDLMERGN